MPISVYIDNNVWDLLFELKIDLSTELPDDEFRLCLTREAEFEIPPIPDEKIELKKFIIDSIERARVKTVPFFGFYDENLPASEPRFAGFDKGVFAEESQAKFIKHQCDKKKDEEEKNKGGKDKKRPTGLFKDEADIAIASRSLIDVIITLDTKNGPIRYAYQEGGCVVYLNEFKQSHLSLSDFIKSMIANRK